MGPGKQDEDSKELVAPNVAVGATVMYSKYSGSEFEVRRRNILYNVLVYILFV